MATFTWVAGASGSVASGGNWLGGHAPGTADVALFPAPGTAGFNGPTIEAGTTFAIAGLAAPDGATTDIELDGTLLLGGTFVLGSGSDIAAGPSGEIVGGTLSLDSPNVQGGTLDGVTVVGTFASADAYLFQPAAITGGFTADVPLLDFGADTTDLLGDQTLSVQTLDANILDATGNVTLDGGTLDAFEYNAQGSATTLALAGTVALGVSLYSVPTIVNSGLLSLVQSASLEMLANSGSISVGPSLDLAATLLTNSGSIAVAAAGTLGASTLDNTGGLIAVASGGRVAGTVTGGTLVGGGGLLDGQVDDATLIGGFLVNSLGLTLSGDTFAPDSLDHTASVTLTFGMALASGTTLNDVNLVFLNNPGDGPTLTGAATFGTATDISFVGTGAAAPAIRGDGALTLGGTVEGYAGTVDIVAGGTLLNTGTIATLAGETLSLYAVRGTIENQGVLNLASGSTVELEGNLSAAGFAGFAQPGVTLLLDGTLSGDGTPTGSIVTLSAGATLDTTGFATLSNLTVDSAGSVGSLLGTLDTVTWIGVPLVIENTGVTYLTGGLTVQGPANAPGELVVGGTNSILNILDNETLDNMAVDIGSSATDPGANSFNLIDGLNPTLGTDSNLTIGTTTTLTVSGNSTFNGLNDIGTLTIAGVVQFGDASSASANTAITNGTSGGSEGSGGVGAGKVDLQGKAIDDAFEAFVTENFGTTDPIPIDQLFGRIFARYVSLGSYRANSADAPAASSPPDGIDQASLNAIETTLDGTGTISIMSGGVFGLDAVTGSGIELTFGQDGGVLALLNPTTMGGQITGFGAGDAIDLAIDGYTGGTATESDGQLVVPTASGDIAVDVQFASGFSAADVQLSDDTAGGTFAYIACFAAGTRIATPDGEQPVETLRPGDCVRTWSGKTRPVVWVGHRTVDCRRHPRPEAVWPVRVRAGAFGPGRPARDLILSPDHALFLDGVLVPVRCLIDGDAIAQLAAERVIYWHVELDRHDILLAEGLPAESFLDTGQRAAFAGGAVSHLHPDFTARAWEADACAPLVLAGPKLARIRARLRRARTEAVIAGKNPVYCGARIGAG